MDKVYADTVRLLLQVAPDVFANDVFAMKGGTATLPAAIGQQTGLQPIVFGLVILFFVLVEPSGLHGRWLKLRTYLEVFPLCPGAVFTRERQFVRTERVK